MRYIATYVETTGPSYADGRRVVEIGAVEFINGIETGNHFHVYVNPERSVLQSAIDQHGITPEFLADKPLYSEVVKEFAEFIASAKLLIFDTDATLPHIIALAESRDSIRPQEVLNNYVDVQKTASLINNNQTYTFEELKSKYYFDKVDDGYVNALSKAAVIGKIFFRIENKSSDEVASDLDFFEESKNLYIANTISEFDELIDNISKTALCRGVSNHEYPLLPSLFRHPNIEGADQREHNLMWVFKAHARGHLKNLPENELEWLTIAQHHGLPTRLLDWSLSPLTALQFSVQSLSQSDGAVYIYDVGKFSKQEEIELSSLEQIVAFFPSHATDRITAQSGMFTIHPTNQKKLENNRIIKILIPAKRKKYFLEKLVKYGIHQGTLFPDLDGISSYVRYQLGY